MTMSEQNGEPNTCGRLYRDLASVEEKDSPNTSSITSRTSSNFPEILHYVLSDMEKDGLQHVASWQPHGRSFVVHDQKLFVEKILPL
jgi:hypothetical protein